MSKLGQETVVKLRRNLQGDICVCICKYKYVICHLAQSFSQLKKRKIHSPFESVLFPELELTLKLCLIE